MATFLVNVEGYFSDSFEIEADSYDEAERDAVRQAQDEYSVYIYGGGYTMPFDDMQVVSVETDDEDVD
jgi:hypothetical protein